MNVFECEVNILLKVFRYGDPSWSVWGCGQEVVLILSGYVRKNRSIITLECTTGYYAEIGADLSACMELENNSDHLIHDPCYVSAGKSAINASRVSRETHRCFMV